MPPSPTRLAITTASAFCTGARANRTPRTTIHAQTPMNASGIAANSSRNPAGAGTPSSPIMLVATARKPIPNTAMNSGATMLITTGAWMMHAALRYLREIDELQRRIETEAIGAASLLVALVYFAGGMLEKAEVVRMDAGVAMIWVFPMLCGLYGIAKMVLTRRYQ